MSVLTLNPPLPQGQIKLLLTSSRIYALTQEGVAVYSRGSECQFYYFVAFEGVYHFLAFRSQYFVSTVKGTYIYDDSTLVFGNSEQTECVTISNGYFYFVQYNVLFTVVYGQRAYIFNFLYAYMPTYIAIVGNFNYILYNHLIHRQNDTISSFETQFFGISQNYVVAYNFAVRVFKLNKNDYSSLYSNGRTAPISFLVLSLVYWKNDTFLLLSCDGIYVFDAENLELYLLYPNDYIIGIGVIGEYIWYWRRDNTLVLAR